MFTKEIEDALAEGRVDLAVHSLKDLPTELPPGFELVAITKRVNPHDVFLSVNYDCVDALPKGAKVGTSSLRRQAQLKAFRPDLVIHPLRGNVDTRVRKLEEGEYDAIILAAAGLTRLGKTQLVREYLPAEFMCPAAGQGALGIEIREGDAEMRKHLAFLNDPDSRAATVCERALLNKLGGGCQVPIGAFAEVKDGKLHLTGVVARPDGSEVLREQQSGADPVALGELVGDDAAEARRQTRSSKRSTARPQSFRNSHERMTTTKPLAGCRVLVSRARKQAGALSSALKQMGCEVIEIPFIEIRKPVFVQAAGYGAAEPRNL